MKVSQEQIILKGVGLASDLVSGAAAALLVRCNGDLSTCWFVGRKSSGAVKIDLGSVIETRP